MFKQNWARLLQQIYQLHARIYIIYNVFKLTGLHFLTKSFRNVTFGDRSKAIVKSLGFIDPIVVQSMTIFKVCLFYKSVLYINYKYNYKYIIPYIDIKTCILYASYIS